MEQALNIPPALAEAAGRVHLHAASVHLAQVAFLSDLIRLQSYTGQEGPAVDRTLVEMRRCGFADVRTDSAGGMLRACSIPYYQRPPIVSAINAF